MWLDDIEDQTSSLEDAAPVQNSRALSKASWDQVQLKSGKKIAFIHNWSSKKEQNQGKNWR